MPALKPRLATSQASPPARPKARPQARFNPTVPTEASVRALLKAFNAFVVADPDLDAEVPMRLAWLLVGMPCGPIRSAHLEAMWTSDVILFQMLGSTRQHRILPIGFLLLRILCMFDGGPFDVRHRGKLDTLDIPILADGFAFTRLMANADEDEIAHRDPYNDLLPWSLSIKPGRPRALRERKEALNYALRHYARNAKAWGLADVLSARDYADLVKGAFRLFDWYCGWHFLRQIGDRPFQIM